MVKVVLFINLSAPRQYGTSERHSTELTYEAYKLWSLEIMQGIDSDRLHYICTAPYWGKRLNGRVCILEPGIFIFRSALGIEDTFVHVRYPDLNEEEVWRALLEVLSIRPVDRVFIITVAQADPAAGPNATSEIHTVYPPKYEDTPGRYTQDSDIFLAPIEWFFTHRKKVSVSYISMHITDKHTSDGTLEFYRDRLREIRNFVPFMGNKLPQFYG